VSSRRDDVSQIPILHDLLQDHKLRLFSRDSNPAVVVAVREALEVCIITTLSLLLACPVPAAEDLVASESVNY